MSLDLVGPPVLASDEKRLTGTQAPTLLACQKLMEQGSRPTFRTEQAPPDLGIPQTESDSNAVLPRDQGPHGRREPEGDEPNGHPTQGVGAATFEADPKILGVVIHAKTRVPLVMKELVFPFHHGLPHAVDDDLGPATLAREIVGELRYPLGPTLDEKLTGHIPAQMLLRGDSRKLLSLMLP